MNNENRADYKRRFGQPEGNKPNGGGFKGGGKTFRQMIAELLLMDEAELKAFIRNETKPKVVRNAAKAMLQISNIKEVSCVADMIESKPVQVIDNKITELPPILQPIELPNDTGKMS